MSYSRTPLALRATVVILLGAALLDCSSSNSSTGSTSGGLGGAGGLTSQCFPDHDGISGCDMTVDVTVNDTTFGTEVDGGFTVRTLISTQNDATVTFTLTNAGTKPHGFEVGCTNVASAYPDAPAECPKTACFPETSTVAPIAPGMSKTITFDTPTPDCLIYPFKSSEAADSDVPGLNDGQWNLM